MKNNKFTLFVFVLLVLAASLYRAWDGRPFGFAPQIAMALFAGAVISNRKLAFLVPVLSMFISDIFYQVLYLQGFTNIPGFYGGQWENYLVIASITFIGFFINKDSVVKIAAGSLAGAVYYFIVSNFLVWIGGGLGINNQPYPKSFAGLMECFAAGLPFFKWSVYSTFIFCGVFFGSNYIFQRSFVQSRVTA